MKATPTGTVARPFEGELLVSARIISRVAARQTEAERRLRHVAAMRPGSISIRAAAALKAIARQSTVLSANAMVVASDRHKNRLNVSLKEINVQGPETQSQRVLTLGDKVRAEMLPKPR